jgi:hypothetical protein
MQSEMRVCGRASGVCCCLHTQPSGLSAWLQGSDEQAGTGRRLSGQFCNPKRKHARNGRLSPAEFERRQMTRREGL